MPLHFSFDHPYQPELQAGLSCLGRIRLPVTLKILTWLLLCGLLLSVTALITVPWVQSTSGMGRVTTLDPRDRVQNISALVSGRVAEWYVRDGAEVAAGDPIVRIEDIDNSLLERLQAQLDAARRKHAAASDTVRTAAIDLSRRQQLFAQGLTSRLEYEQADIRMQQLRIAEEQALADLNQAEVNLSRQGSQLVVAPRAGTIVHVEAGDVATVVSAGQALASFLPANSERAIEIFVDGRDIGLVRPGRPARIEFEGWPAFQFSGMPDYAVGTFPGEVFFVEPSARPDGRFRVLIRELREEPCVTTDLRPGMNPANVCGWPPESFVRLGASARAWIQLETVPLGYELWRLLNSFPPLSVTAASDLEPSR
jgi:multidrug efflux pump subunit AcrA (membrane-fusion protein)